MFSSLLTLTSLALGVFTCDDCYGPRNDAAHVRHVRRMQPEAQGATTSPRAPLAWGDLHDGNGLSDASTPNGVISNAIFENVGYDLLAIGNHELYVTDIAYETFNQFSKVYGDRYVTSNVQIMNPATGKFEYMGSKYRYFTTDHGLRIMAFGVLYDFTGNSNVSKVIRARDLVQEEWFLEAVNYPKPVDLFIVVGHNPVRTTGLCRLRCHVHWSGIRYVMIKLQDGSLPETE
ncbi:MAG: hypothetical protein Q9173_003378 [Seirophora scorigena]